MRFRRMLAARAMQARRRPCDGQRCSMGNGWRKQFGATSAAESHPAAEGAVLCVLSTAWIENAGATD